MNVMCVVGARPNFMKIAPLMIAMKHSSRLEAFLLHTGQHYDWNMSKSFFEDLNIPEPDDSLDIGSGTHAVQTAGIMIKFEKVLIKKNPGLVIVVGDVNSTLACTLTAIKLRIKIAHIEAGLRSFDMSMPEEANRKVTDVLSDYLFTPSKDANINLEKEGVSSQRIFLVGNIMIDSLKIITKAIKQNFENEILKTFNVQRNKFALVTLHRPSNVDDRDRLEKIMDLLLLTAEKIPVLFPIHPRTAKSIDALGVSFQSRHFKLIDPLRYKEFIALEKNAQFVLTDSGGIQEETTYFGVPCLTLRPNTERPVTVSEGTNELITLENVDEKIERIVSGKWKKGTVPELWDGQTAKRIVHVLENECIR